MNCLKSNNLALYRGNSADFVLKPIYEDGTDVALEEGDRILFTVCSRPDSQSEIRYSRVFDMNDCDAEGRIVLRLKPEDTVKFQVHTYWYDVAICFADGSFYTFVPYSRFDILPTLGDVRMLQNHKNREGGKVCGTVQGVVEKAQRVYETELTFKTYKDFPSVGEADKLYIATDEELIYRFDAKQMIYKVVGGNPANIKEIYCKL